MPAWSARLSSNIIPQYAIASVSSNLWPGAHAYVTGKNTFENIYIGWGLKYSSVAFNPLLPPTVQEEFPIGADVIETTDPTVEQEAALKSKLEEADIAAEEEEEPEDSDDEG
jgi:radial spoke head protein 4A